MDHTGWQQYQYMIFVLIESEHIKIIILLPDNNKYIATCMLIFLDVYRFVCIEQEKKIISWPIKAQITELSTQSHMHVHIHS